MIYQQAPYWLNGFLPLAYQLKNAGIETLSPKCGLRRPERGGHAGHSHAQPSGPVRPLAQVKAYIDGIMARVQPDGWVGPPPAAAAGPFTPTPRCEAGRNLFGGDLAPSAPLPAAANASSCAALCRADGACAAYVFEAGGCQGVSAHCWLKGGGWKPQQFNRSGCDLCSQVLRSTVPKKKGNGDQSLGLGCSYGRPGGTTLHSCSPGSVRVSTGRM